MIDNRDFSFNKKRDIKKVAQYGFIDLHAAYQSGVVPADIEEPSVQYNGIESPDNIVGKPSDIFEAYRMHSAVSEIAQKSAAESGEEPIE